jgi:putative ABC transport system permease protein
MDTLLQDIRYGIRLLLKSPGFTAAAILTLALGIGANAAVFSVADAFLRKPIWFPNIDSLVALTNIAPDGADDRDSVSPADYLDWKAQSRSFEQVGASEWVDVNLTGSGDPQKLQGAAVTSNFFAILQMPPKLGRAFLPEEEQPGHEREVILGNGLWVRQFGSDPNVVGKTVQIDGLGNTIVGVMGDDFDFPVSAQIWLPMALSDKEKTARGVHGIRPIARLNQGVSVEQGQTEITTIEARLQKEFPVTEKGWTVRVLPMRTYASDTYSRQYSVLLLCAVGFVLLIACANVANVQLARATARQKEFAVREAIGASRWRIIRQLLTESTLLSLAGAGIGLLLANWAIGLILSHMPPDVERYIAAWKHIRLDFDVFLYTVAIAFVAGIVSGLAPAFQGARADLVEQLKESGRGTTAGKARRVLRNAFVVGEIAVSLILLIGAGLTVKGVRALLNVHANLSPASILTLRVALPPSKYSEPAKQVAYYDRALQQVSSVPGVRSASIATLVPFGDGGDSDSFHIEGIPAQPGEVRLINSESVSSGYFQTMNIPLREGRFFTEQDGADSPRVVIVSQRLAQRFWPNESPLGKHIQRGDENASEHWATIVGVAGDLQYTWIQQEDVPVLYFPYKQVPRPYSFLAVRADNPMASVAAVRAGLALVDSNQPLYEIKTLDTVIGEAVIGLSYVAVMMAVLGVIALVLASVGVYGVMAYAVVERTHEIGVRLALGAQPREILRIILSRGIFLTGLGLLIGLPLAFGLTKVLANLFIGVSATDPAIFSGISVLLAAIAMVACYIPARRAMRVDPMVALRYE